MGIVVHLAAVSLPLNQMVLTLPGSKGKPGTQSQGTISQLIISDNVWAVRYNKINNMALITGIFFFLKFLKF